MTLSWELVKLVKNALWRYALWRVVFAPVIARESDVNLQRLLLLDRKSRSAELFFGAYLGPEDEQSAAK